MSSHRIATVLTADNSTRVSIFREVNHAGRTIFIVDFVHMVKRDADRRSTTWKVEFTEAAARKAANECFAKWNGSREMLVA
ncbi:hypothetical protein [Microbacterium sp. VKM Ac-2923]|uniref:hypothetical protein n=1 Tax=Microbacterium sp. VKM Ac-2923 TaxID=2929476 RepID=UPI001FB44F77|nr:hypothetical protein [Microbacterium sp. VKM Ac-2923]MCJ1709257.1 hypothetical protein [Microbacterium sp. VKM Ac-2923]